MIPSAGSQVIVAYSYIIGWGRGNFRENLRTPRNRDELGMNGAIENPDGRSHRGDFMLRIHSESIRQLVGSELLSILAVLLKCLVKLGFGEIGFCNCIFYL